LAHISARNPRRSWRWYRLNGVRLAQAIYAFDHVDPRRIQLRRTDSPRSAPNLPDDSGLAGLLVWCVNCRYPPAFSNSVCIKVDRGSKTSVVCRKSPKRAAGTVQPRNAAPVTPVAGGPASLQYPLDRVTKVVSTAISEPIGPTTAATAALIIRGSPLDD
jgi:hypothetical protein